MSLIKDFKDLFFTMIENPNNFAYEDRLMMLVIISAVFLFLSWLLISMFFSLPGIIHSVIDFCGNILKKILKRTILTDKKKDKNNHNRTNIKKRIFIKNGKLVIHKK